MSAVAEYMNLLDVQPGCMRTSRRVIRAYTPTDMCIEHSVTNLHPSPSVLAQVLVRSSEDGELEAFGMGVDVDWKKAQKVATLHAINVIMNKFETGRALNGLTEDLYLSKHAEARLQKQLAVDGGAWVEEQARPKCRERTRRMFSVEARLPLAGDSLSEIALLYSI